MLNLHSHPITIVTAGTERYMPMIAQTCNACMRLNYGGRVYDLGGLGFGYDWKVSPSDFGGVVPPNTFKPSLLLDAQQYIAQGKIFAWLDGDAILANPLDELLSMNFDVAVTLRDVEEIGTTGRRDTDFLNSGGIFFRRTTAANSFLADWLKLCERYGDQEALNELVGPGWLVANWKQAHGKTFVRDGVSVMILHARMWNNWHEEKYAKILHYKGSART